MDEFQLQLQGLIAQNKIPKVIEILLETLQKCQSKSSESDTDVSNLRNQVVILSSRYNSTNDKILKGIMDPIHADTAKNQIISSFLNLINQLPNSESFSNYINHREEIEAWDKALQSNTIAAYKSFFTQYPNGKYKDETQRVISELENIQKEKESEIKQKAEEEQARRVKEQEEIKEREQANSELHRIKKEKKELLAKKQKAQDELDAIERQTQTALNKEKEQSAIAQNNKASESAELKKAQQELEIIRKEKEVLLAKKQQTEADLQKVEQQRKAAAKRQKTASSKKEKPKVSTKTPAKQKAQAAAGVAMGAAATAAASSSTENQSFFKKLFNKNNRWWTLTSIILAPITGIVIGIADSSRSIPDSVVFFFLGLTFICYLLSAFKFPLKPAWHSLIATAIGALLFTLCFTSNMRYGSSTEDYLFIFFIAFLPLSLFALLICFFRNRSIAKKE